MVNRMKHSTHSCTRREFIRLGGVGIGALALMPAGGLFTWAYQAMRWNSTGFYRLKMMILMPGNWSESVTPGLILK